MEAGGRGAGVVGGGGAGVWVGLTKVAPGVPVGLAATRLPGVAVSGRDTEVGEGVGAQTSTGVGVSTPVVQADANMRAARMAARMAVSETPN